MKEYPYCTAKQFEIRFVVYHYPDRNMGGEYLEEMKRSATYALMQKANEEMQDCSYVLHISKWQTMHLEQDHITFEPPRTFYSRLANLDLYSL